MVVCPSMSSLLLTDAALVFVGSVVAHFVVANEASSLCTTNRIVAILCGVLGSIVVEAVTYPTGWHHSIYVFFRDVSVFFTRLTVKSGHPFTMSSDDKYFTRNLQISSFEHNTILTVSCSNDEVSSLLVPSHCKTLQLS